MVIAIGDVHIAWAIHEYSIRIVQWSLCGEYAIAVVASRARSSYRRNISVGTDFANTMVIEIGDVHIAWAIHEYT